jgi:hypothetical protein
MHSKFEAELLPRGTLGLSFHRPEVRFATESRAFVSHSDNEMGREESKTALGYDKFPEERFLFEETIGEGSYGKVIKAFDTKNQCVSKFSAWHS